MFELVANLPPLVRIFGQFLLMAMPGLAPLLLLPLLHAAKPEQPAQQTRLKRWLLGMIMTLIVLGLAVALGAVSGRHIIPSTSLMLILGLFYVRNGADNIAKTICRLNKSMLQFAGMACLACALFMLINIVLRYVFATGFGWARETVIYAHAACFMLGAAGTLACDGHVRIDIIRSRLSPTQQAQIELIACIIFLAPVMLLILHVFTPQLALAWGSGSGRVETSDESDGLPLGFLFKTMVPIFALSMLAQGWANAWKAAGECRYA